jgi:myo-inositol-1(or 4)-monophosphatase
VTLEPAAARDVALEVAGLAADLLRGVGGHTGPIRAKEHATDLVTEWDERAEELIVAELARRAPGVAIVGEELGAREGGGADADARWLVDPIDGTVNFAHGFPIFSVSIGYELLGEPVAGVVAAPALGWTFAAARGEGATLNGAAIHVSAVADLGRALLVTGFPYDRRVSPRNNLDAWAHMQRTAGAVRRLGAASLDLCFVACGWLDGYWEIKLKPWDLSAGACIVREAGGIVTAIDGGPFSSGAGDVAASNGRIHEALVRELAGRL